MFTTPKKKYSNLGEKFCRLCGSEKDFERSTNVFSKSGIRKNLATTISELLRVFIEEGDGLPSNICRQCEGMLLRFSEFKSLVINTQSQLKQRVTTKRCKVFSPTCEPDKKIRVVENRSSARSLAFGNDLQNVTNILNSVQQNNHDMDTDLALVESAPATTNNAKRGPEPITTGNRTCKKRSIPPGDCNPKGGMSISTHEGGASVPNSSPKGGAPVTNSNALVGAPVTISNAKGNALVTTSNAKGSAPVTIVNPKRIPPVTTSNAKGSALITTSNAKESVPPATSNPKRGAPVTTSNAKESAHMTNSNAKGGAPVATNNPKGGTPVTNSHAKGGAPVTNSNPKGGAPVTNSNAKRDAPVTTSNAEGSAPVTNSNPIGGAPVTNSNAKGDAPVTTSNAKGSAPVTNSNPNGGAPVTNSNPKGGAPVTNSDPKGGAPVATSNAKEAAPVTNSTRKNPYPVATTILSQAGLSNPEVRLKAFTSFSHSWDTCRLPISAVIFNMGHKVQLGDATLLKVFAERFSKQGIANRYQCPILEAP